MRGEFDAAGELWACRVNGAESAVTVTEPGKVCFRIEPEIIGVGQFAQALNHYESCPIEQLEGAVVTVSNGDLVLMREVEDAGGLGHTGNALNAFASSEVND